MLCHLLLTTYYHHTLVCTSVLFMLFYWFALSREISTTPHGKTLIFSIGHPYFLQSNGSLNPSIHQSAANRASFLVSSAISAINTCLSIKWEPERIPLKWLGKDTEEWDNLRGFFAVLFQRERNAPAVFSYFLCMTLIAPSMDDFFLIMKELQKWQQEAMWF